MLCARMQPPIPSPLGLVVPTLHPARVLRRPDELPLLTGDLTRARDLAGDLRSGGGYDDGHGRRGK